MGASLTRNRRFVLRRLVGNTPASEAHGALTPQRIEQLYKQAKHIYDFDALMSTEEEKAKNKEIDLIGKTIHLAKIEGFTIGRAEIVQVLDGRPD